MIKLEPLKQEDFDRFLEREIVEYANDHVRNGNWPAEGALERSRKEYEQYLPDGVRDHQHSHAKKAGIEAEFSITRWTHRLHFCYTDYNINAGGQAVCSL